MKFICAATLAVALAQDPHEPDAVLARARQKIVALADRLPRYTCLETIDREYLEAPVRAPRGKVMSAYAASSCSATLDHLTDDLTIASRDRLRLEVTVADQHEIESWPGGRFDTRGIDELVKSGPTSTGSFGPYLIEVFEDAGAKFEFTREMAAAGRRVFEYRFRIPLESSHYRARAAAGFVTTASSGLFEVDAVTADLTRFTIQTDLLPPEAQWCLAKTAIDYQHLRIGDSDFLIPLKSEYETVQLDSGRTKSTITFSACHEYAAQSTVRYEDANPAAVQARHTQATAAAFPAGLSLSLKLTAPIDTRTAAAGDVVFATVSKAVVSPGSKTILIPAGARARGRITEMRRFIKTAPRFQIGLIFDTLDLNGAETPVTLALDRGVQVEQPNKMLSESLTGVRLQIRPIDLNIPPPNSSAGGGLFVFVTAESRYFVPAGYESKWITRVPKP